MKVWVIRDRHGKYVSLYQNYFVIYSGRCSGFTFYTNKYLASQELKLFNDNNLVLDYIDITDIPKGKRIGKYNPIDSNT